MINPELQIKSLQHEIGNLKKEIKELKITQDIELHDMKRRYYQSLITYTHEVDTITVKRPLFDLADVKGILISEERVLHLLYIAPPSFYVRTHDIWSLIYSKGKVKNVHVHIWRIRDKFKKVGVDIIVSNKTFGYALSAEGREYLSKHTYIPKGEA